MSNRVKDNDDQQRNNKPTFSGNTMPLNIDPTISLDCGVGEEITRRVGVFQPCFESVASFQPPMMDKRDNHSHVGNTKGTVTREKTTVASARKITSSVGTVWPVDSVPSLPEFYPLERTSVFVPNVITPSDITSRISDILRDRSIETIYDKDKATCTTMEGVEFRVRLYRGRGRYHHGVIVEVQRRFGISNSFYNDTMAILNAAEGKDVPSHLTMLSSSTVNIPLVVPDFEDESESPIDGKSSLHMISTMLGHPGYDSHFLALQTLSSLTDASKIGNSTARMVSTELFRLDNDNEVGAKILSLIIDKQGEDDTFKLRSMALNVAANAFQAVEGEFPLMLKEQLRSVLLEELRSASGNARNAVQAARIMQYLVPEENGSDVHSALEIAHQAGISRNALLERHVQVCLDKLC
jgi:hypothetical protein